MLVACRACCPGGHRLEDLVAALPGAAEGLAGVVDLCLMSVKLTLPLEALSTALLPHRKGFLVVALVVFWQALEPPPPEES